MKTAIVRALYALAYTLQANARHAQARAVLRDRLGLTHTRAGV